MTTPTRIRSLMALAMMLCLSLFTPSLAETSHARVPRFEATGSLGEVRLPDEDQPLTIVLFWATWCPYCKQLMPHLQSVLDQYPDAGIRVLALSIKDDGQPADYLQERGFDFNLIRDADAIAQSYRVHAVPAMLLVDHQGQVLFNLATLQASERQRAAEQTDSHWQKAARLAPWWAAELRRVIQRWVDAQPQTPN